MSKSDTTGKPDICDDCSKEIPLCVTVFICSDGKIRCFSCYKRWAGAYIS